MGFTDLGNLYNSISNQVSLAQQQMALADYFTQYTTTATSDVAWGTSIGGLLTSGNLAIAGSLAAQPTQKTRHGENVRWLDRRVDEIRVKL